MAVIRYRKYFAELQRISGPALLLCCVQQSVAQTSLDSPGTRSLQPIIVNARKENLRSYSGTPVQLLGGSELERINSLSVADAIRYFSGVQLKDYGGVGGLKTINVRSLGANHTGVFYDGVELGNAQNGQVDLGKFSLDNIDEIALYDGQQSNIFQPAKGFASGNALFLSSRTPVFSDGTKSIEKISFKTGSFGLLDPSLLWQYRISPHVNSSISTEWIQSTGKYPFRYSNGVYDTTAVRHNGDLHAFRAEAGLNVSGNDSSAWQTKIYFYNSDRGLPGAIISNKFDYTQRQWDRNLFAQSSYHRNLGKKFRLLANAKYANDYTRYLDPEFVTATGFLDNRYAQQELYGSIAGEYYVNSFLNLSAAEDFQWDKLDANIYHFAYPVRKSFLSSVAAELHFQRFNLQANLLQTFVHDAVRDFSAAGNKQALSPALLFSWQPVARSLLHLRGFYKSAFRLPSFNDLYYTFVGNTLLRPEYTKQYDLGVTYRKDYNGRRIIFFSGQVDVYDNQVTDKIVAVPGANLFRWTMYNLGKVSIQGIDANGQAGIQLTQTMLAHVGLSYSFQQALDVTGGDNYRSQIPYTPRNSGSAVAGLDIEAFTLNYSFIYTGSRYDEKANIPVNYLQPWYTHDLSVGWKTIYHQDILKINVEVNNLFNQYYDVISNFPMPGRSFRLTINYQR